MNSKLFKLNRSDLLKGLVVAVLVAALQVVLTLLGTKGLDLSLVDWWNVLDISVKAAGAYLLKNMFSTQDGKLLGAV